MNVLKALFRRKPPADELPPVHPVVAGLPLPHELLSLIAAGRWPRSQDEVLRQNLHTRIPAERIHRIAPDEDRIFFDPPPFQTAESLLRLPGKDFHGAPDPDAAPGDIVFSRAIILGDFGIGSDAPFALDYRLGSECPPIIRLRWTTPSSNNRWVYAAPSFARFAELLEL